MEKLVEVINLLQEAREKMAELKLWLNQKEVVEYFNWKQENPKDRTAMDKVIAQLKMNDENWLLKEQEYYKWKNRYEYVKNIYDLVSDMLSNVYYTKDDVNKFLENLI